ncbi:MAG: hypothetical protein WAT66_02960 [Actinomycetota bacterium]
MGKHLKLGADPTVSGWTLPDHTDVDKLRDELADAMEQKSTVRVPIIVGSNQSAELVVNGDKVVAALVWEDAPAGGGITIID